MYIIVYSHEAAIDLNMWQRSAEVRGSEGTLHVYPGVYQSNSRSETKTIFWAGPPGSAQRNGFFFIGYEPWENTDYSCGAMWALDR